MCSFGLVEEFIKYMEYDHPNNKEANTWICLAMLEANVISIMEVQKFELPRKVCFLYM